MKVQERDAAKSAAAASEHLMQVAMGYIASMCLQVVARLGIADRLAAGPKPAAELAAASGTNEDALYRVLRALSTVGIFQQLDGRRFQQTAASDFLRKDHPQSLLPAMVFLPDPLHYRVYANLMHSVKTGEPAVALTFGKPAFEYLRDDPEESAVFNAAMVTITRLVIPAVLESYDFSSIRTLVDVGGGLGSVVASVLRRHPKMQGILYDLDYVTRAAGPALSEAGVADRCRVISGNFFESVPAGGDAYIMKNIIHDWDDAKCTVILKNIRTALGHQPNGKVLLIESVVPADPSPHPSKWFDIEMMVLPGGRERTDDEFRKLFAGAGMRVTRIIPTPSMAYVIEGVVN